MRPWSSCVLIARSRGVTLGKNGIGHSDPNLCHKLKFRSANRHSFCYMAHAAVLAVWVFGRFPARRNAILRKSAKKRPGRLAIRGRPLRVESGVWGQLTFETGAEPRTCHSRSSSSARHSAPIVQMSSNLSERKLSSSAPLPCSVPVQACARPTQCLLNLVLSLPCAQPASSRPGP